MQNFLPILSANKKLFLLSVIPISILIVLLSFLIALPLNSVLLDRPFFSYKEYFPLDNWNLPVHMMHRDLDGDGRNDLITVTGCAFFSSVRPEQIPAEKRCEAPTISMIEENAYPVGQHIGHINKKGNFVVDWEGYSFFAYMVRTNEEQWLLIRKQSFIKPAKAYEIDQQGFIQPTSLPLIHRLYVLSYTLASLLLIPIFAVMFYLPFLLHKVATIL